MITGTSQADCALLIVSSSEGEFEFSVSQQGQTREQALLSFTLGIKHMIVCINKMDKNTVNFSQERYESIKYEISDYLTQIGYNKTQVQFIPLSGGYGDNLIKKSPNLPWYQGPTLVAALDQIQPPKLQIGKPLRLSLQDVYKIDGIGTVLFGRVETGVFKSGMQIIFAPSGIQTEVKSIEEQHKSLSEALPGDNIGFNIKSVKATDLKRGEVCGDQNNDPPKQVSEFIAQLMILNHPTKIENGYCPILNSHNAHITCEFHQILNKIDRRTGKILEQNPKFIKTGDCCTVKMIPKKPICCEAFNEYPTLGRFIIRDMKYTIAIGIIINCTKKESFKRENKNKS